MATNESERHRKPPNGDLAMVEDGRRRYLVAPRRVPGAWGGSAIRAGHLKALIDSIPGVKVERVVRPRMAAASFTTGADEATELYVATLEENQAEMLRQTAPAHLIVEEDTCLDVASPATAVLEETTSPTTAAATSRIKPRPIRFRVLGHRDKPLANAVLTLRGEGCSARGVTDDKGELTLDLCTIADQAPRALLAGAESGHWDRCLVEPELSDSRINAVRLEALEETIRGFPEQFHYGWGARLMGLDRLDRRLTGAGVRIGLIDSGVDCKHPLLKHVRQGVDLTNRQDSASWCDDLTGHGTHCAGTIAARGENGTALRGFAPDAEVHVFKVVPGARCSSLIEALDLCLERGVDLVNIGVGTAQPSLAVEQKLEECVAAGIACIAGAGNTGGPVQHPASSPWVLAVSAVGRLGEMPPGTWARSTVLPDRVAADGVFSPAFTCFGPEIGACAPGVGVISTAPDGRFVPRSGTSIAAPHLTGVAALLLAHHPWFGTFPARSPQRVAALFELIRSMCVPYPFGPGRTGAGVPRLELLQHLLTSVPTAYAGAPGASVVEPMAGPIVPGMSAQHVAGATNPGTFAHWTAGTPAIPR